MPGPEKIVVQGSGLSQGQGGAPMQTECSADGFEIAPVEKRPVVVGFDGGAITSDAGALLSGGDGSGERRPRSATTISRPLQSADAWAGSEARATIAGV